MMIYPQKLKTLLLTLILIANFAVAEAQQSYMHLKGKLGDKTLITMDLNIDADNLINGSYYYEKYGKPIRLKGEFRGSDLIVLNELSENSNTQAIFTGKFSSQGFIGKWEQVKSNASKLDFVLKENYTQSLNFRNVTHKVQNDRERYDFQYICLEPFKVSKRLRRQIGEFAFATYYNQNQSFDAIIKKIQKEDYQGFQADNELMKGEGGEGLMGWGTNLWISVAFNDLNLVSYTANGYNYRGGAHGIPYFSALNLDLTTEKPLTLADVSSNPQNLHKHIIASLRENYSIPNSESLEEFGLSSEANIPVPEVFTFDKAGVTFHYGAYEIGPYAIGMPQAFVPWDKIKDSVPSRSPLRRLFAQ
ncbi:MAG: DUF3298 domain-containing protein [Bernardetiaceae bacterium]|nr:DUF3298 domain-containing protein [Bernardetiaceae bacterium]